MASERPVTLTAEGKADLERELHHLRTVKLPDVTARIQELSMDGDVSDNSEYEDTKEELIQLEARIREIENLLRRVRVIAPGKSDGVVKLGSRVTIVDETGQAETWILVSPEEANTLQGKISTESPVGAALLDKRVGDSVVVRAPGGETSFTIEKVE
ncbi:transcription elongation factor GreA [Sphaerobacter thermophilus]|uniref:Transcription elongation factor GreA n=1 Tax=Sphaerobacter thermophilus (strain ATCC 49802 / DSM 20745 / KCCM 41009 / NCIMB 13125 / S 6022) TaxID=479434 RepID=D1C2T0_SPHTD|nr:transcription elongation factor GreA [Sphaerobacter thermophilus]ACZ38547.1 GreA/GreB family elongation factor [Sphaerobacter thermophilus DSM 20745]PZN68071.1 MAG: transcription elongation factor GreA [Sphaerobacter thermophilus]